MTIEKTLSVQKREGSGKGPAGRAGGTLWGAGGGGELPGAG